MGIKDWLLILGVRTIIIFGLAGTSISKTILIDDFEGGWSWWSIKTELKLVSPGCPDSKGHAAFASFSTPRGVGVIRRKHDFKSWRGADHITFWLKGDGSDREAYLYLYDDHGAQYHPFPLKETDWHKVTLYFKNFISKKYGRCIGGVDVDRLSGQIDIYADKGASFTLDHLQVCSSDEVVREESIKYENLNFRQIDRPVIRVPRIKTSPTIDGRLEESLWRQAAEVSQFFDLFGEQAKLQTKVLLAYDDSNIYFAFVCTEPNIDYVKAKEKRRDGLVWEDDCVEIFLQPYFDKEHKERYYHLIANAIGTKYDEMGRGGTGWDPEWQVKTSFASTFWIAEIAVPFDSLVSHPPRVGDVWRLNLSRAEKVKGEHSSWAWAKGGFHKPERFGYLIFGDETSPSFSQLDLGKGFSLGDNFVRFNLKNNNPSQKIVLKVDVEDTLAGYSLYQDTLAVEPNKKETVSVKYRIKERGKHSLRIRITESGGGPVYQSEVFPFTIPPILVVSLDRSDRYYYEADKELQLKVRLNLENTVDLKGMQLRVFLKKGEKVIEEKTLEVLSSEEIDLPFDLSSLSLGKYTVSVSLLDEKGKVLASSLEGFQKVKTPLVRIDEEGRVLIEGKPVFLRVAWVRPINYVAYPEHLTKEIVEKVLSEVKDAGFNAVELVGVSYYVSHPEYYQRCLDIARQKGLKVMAELWGIGLLEVFKEDKNIFAWYISDEPEFRGTSREDIINKHKLYKESDPYHRPTVMSNALPDGIIKYAGITDIHSTHPYPIPFQPLSVLYHQVKMVVDLSKGRKVSPWAIIQLHDLSRYGTKGGRAPTPEEVRCLVYLAITAGAKGLMFYSYYDPNGGWGKDVTFWSIPEDYPAINEELKKLNAEIEELTPVILSKDAKYQCVLKEDNPSIHFILKQYNEILWLIVVNSERKSLSASFAFPGLKVKEIKSLFSKRSITHNGDSFTVGFQPYGVEVYQIFYK